MVVPSHQDSDDETRDYQGGQRLTSRPGGGRATDRGQRLGQRVRCPEAVAPTGVREDPDSECDRHEPEGDLPQAGMPCAGGRGVGGGHYPT